MIIARKWIQCIIFFWECDVSKKIIADCLSCLTISIDIFNDFEFLFGKDDVQVDNVFILIKYMTYSVKQHKKVYHDNYFAREIEHRFMADKNSLSHTKLNIKWALIKK